MTKPALVVQDQFGTLYPIDPGGIYHIQERGGVGTLLKRNVKLQKAHRMFIQPLPGESFSFACKECSILQKATEPDWYMNVCDDCLEK